MDYCDYHKYHISHKIESIKETIFNRLLPVYQNIEKEAKRIEKDKLEESNRTFDPDTMDLSYGYEEAWDEGMEHYALQHAMKNEFLLSTVTWLFHLFEKDYKEMCPSLCNKPEELKSKLQEMGINCDIDSNWHKTNTELRLLANTIKHGEGRSYNQLKNIKPQYFQTTPSYLTDNKVEVLEEDIREYINNMTWFWDSFFDKVLAKNVCL